MADKIIISKFEGKDLHDAHSIHAMTPDVSTYIVDIGDPVSSSHSTISVGMPSDVLMKSDGGIEGSHYKGLLPGGTLLSPTYTPEAVVGDLYKVSSEGIINTTKVEECDMLVCIKDTSVANASDALEIDANWNYIQRAIAVNLSLYGHTHDVEINTETDFGGAAVPTGIINSPNITVNASKQSLTYLINGQCDVSTVSETIGTIYENCSMDPNDNERLVFNQKTIVYDRVNSILFQKQDASILLMTDMSMEFASDFTFTGNPLPLHRHNVQIKTTSGIKPGQLLYYTSTDGQIVDPNDETVFGATLLSNSYNEDQGLMIFDAPVTQIGNEAMMNCTTLASMNIPNEATSIDQYSFASCSNMEQISIPNSVESIGDYTFNNCSKLSTINYNGLSSEWRDISKGNGWDKVIFLFRI